VHNDCIAIRLRLPGLAVLGVREWEGCIEVVARYSSEEGVCPRCGRSTWQVHQWHQQRLPTAGRQARRQAVGEAGVDSSLEEALPLP